MEKRKIGAKIVADSVAPNGKRITTYLLSYPRSIHSELMTHRLFSRNAASSRAIPFSKMIDQIKDDPFIPIAWQKKHSGMQGTEYHDDTSRLIETWLKARDYAVEQAQRLDLQGATKQIVNRLIEPFVWYNVLVTATEYDNFFNLRCPQYHMNPNSGELGIPYRSKNSMIESTVVKLVQDHLRERPELDWIKSSVSGAEIHIQELAGSMYDARMDSDPTQLRAGEWHIPFGDKMDTDLLRCQLPEQDPMNVKENNGALAALQLKIATARAARLSYNTFDGEINYAKDIELHDRLLASKHMSPFEHCAVAMNPDEYDSFINGYLEVKEVEEGIMFGVAPNEKGWCMNFNGFIPYRYVVERNNSRK